MVRLVLRFFDAISWLIVALGADYRQFRAILEVKLSLSSRRPMNAFQMHNQKKGSNALLGAMVSFLIMGVFIIFTIWLAGSPLVSMTIVHAFVMTMLSLSLVADFSSVLLDTTDSMILQPRPVSDRTILLARLAHIIVYLGLLTFALSLATFIAGTIRWGWAFPPVFALTLACSVLFAVFAVTLFYLVAMRVTTGERLRDIIVYVQVFMSVFIIVGYQLLPRLIDMNALKNLRIDDRAWIYFCPPTWMAAPIDLLAGHVGGAQLTLAGMSLVIPLLGMWVSVQCLGAGFSRSLNRMDAQPAQAGRKSKRSGASLGAWLGRHIYRSPMHQAVFELVWTLCGRDRQFKQRTYASLAMVLIWPVIWVISGQHDLSKAFAELPQTNKHLLVLYAVSALLPTVLINVRFCGNWQAGWIYTALPVTNPGAVFAASLAAMMCRFVLPVFAFISAVTFGVWGVASLDDILLAGCGVLGVCSFYGVAFGRHFPFSQESSMAQSSGRAGQNLLLMVIPLALGGLHYVLLLFYPGMILPAAIPVLLLATLGFHRLGRTSWEQVE